MSSDLLGPVYFFVLQLSLSDLPVMIPLPAAVPELDEDVPVLGLSMNDLDGLPALIFGAGTFSNQYNPDDLLTSDVPVRVVRLGLRYGITAFDTSAYYGPSELVLGNALQLLKDEFPRLSYKLITKCGRFGPSNFDYSPTSIRDCVNRSLKRLQTPYLDAVYLHDVEFVATPYLAKANGNHITALTDETTQYGLALGEEAIVRGDGDQKILDAFAELQKMKEEGLIKEVGMTGYPLPTLLRLSLLILHSPPFKPVDILLSYSHISFQNSTFVDFIPEFRERAKVNRLISASPFSMGLLTPSGPPGWHPAPKGLLDAIAKIRQEVQRDIANLALGYSIRKSTEMKTPMAAGFSNPEEVHECVKVWRALKEGFDDERRLQDEARAREILAEAGYLDWSWSSP
ncbi:Aldo/keto reductase [Mycena floridula]|nr:Aldo/keto reductase [Mycena floridula]